MSASSSQMPSTMLAIQLQREDPNVPPTIRLLTVPTPTPTGTQLLVRVHASAIQPSDVLNAAASFPQTTFPRIPGRDFSGTIVGLPTSYKASAATSATPWRIDDAVFGTSGPQQSFTVDGAYAQYLLVSPDAVARKPHNLSFAQAATLGVPYSTAALCLKRASIAARETVFVLGGRGAVGAAVVALARAAGATVWTGERSSGGDVNTTEDKELLVLGELTKGRGVDVVVDTVGSPDLAGAAIERLATRGKYVFISGPKGPGERLQLDMVPFYRGEKSILGCNSLAYSEEECAELLAGMTGLFENSALKAPGEWEKVHLEHAVDVYEKLRAGAKGKYVVVME